VVKNHLTHRVITSAGRDGDTKLHRLEQRLLSEQGIIASQCLRLATPLGSVDDEERKGIGLELMHMIKASNSHHDALIT